MSQVLQDKRMARLKVLISAHEISPDQGSECAEGWNLVTGIARYHDITVLHAAGSQFAPLAYETAIRRYYSENDNEHSIQFVSIPQPRLTLWIASLNKRVSRNTSTIGLPFLYFIGYRCWQKSAYRAAQSLVANGDSSQAPFAVCHHLTQIAFREPGFLWKLNVPFVWGPTGGNAAVPVSFFRHIGLRAAVFEIIRALSNRLILSHGRRVRQAIRRSALIYAFSREDQELFRERGASRVEVMLDAGCNPTVGGSPTPSASGRLRILWCGNLIKRKALEILLEAVAGDPELAQRTEITIVGDGPLRAKYEAMIKRLHLTRATISGWLSRERVFEYMRESDVLVHTSYREATSNVIPEALSCGLPVVCHDVSGMSIAVTDACGIKVPLASHRESIWAFRGALRRLLDDPQGLATLKSGAVRRSGSLSWDAMAAQISQDYCLLA